jgi:putative hydrolase of the HAD superfamily
MGDALNKAERSPTPETRRAGPDRRCARPTTPASVALSSADKRKLQPAPEPRIRAVTFDVGGTLITCWPSVGHIYAEVASRHGHRRLSPAVLNRRFNAAWRTFKGFHHTRNDWSALVDTTFRGIIEPQPSETFFQQLYDRFSEPDAWHVYPDVVPTLTALTSRGLKLGIISNWDDRLRPLLRRLELDRYFKTIVVSCELGACKPGRELFAAACDGLGSTAETTLHVGDSLEMDALGARSAGLHGLYLRRKAKRLGPGEISSLLELDKI